MRKRTFIIGIALIGILVVAALAWPRQRATVSKVTVTFLRYTNIAAGTNWAVLAITNYGPMKMWFFDQYTVYLRKATGSFRSDTTLALGAAYSGDPRGKATAVKAGDSRMVEVSVGPPVSGDSWRAVFVLYPSSLQRKWSGFVSRLKERGVPVAPAQFDAVCPSTEWVQY